MQFIDLARQQEIIKADLQSRIDKVLAHGRYIMGPEVGELEQALQDYTGAKHAIGVANGTDAILIALMALGVGPGDEVITTAFTFIANAEMIAILGAKPVFVDIDPVTCNLDPDKVEAAITTKTKVILAVDLYGQLANYKKLNRIANTHNLKLISDAAQTFGASQDGKKAGVFGDITCTSFFPSKPLGCYGDGGACFTDNDALATAMRQIRVHGQSARYQHTRLGINARLDTMQAAILLSKLTIFDKEVAARAELGDYYTSLLKDYVQTPVIAPGNSHVYGQYTIRVKNRENIQAQLQEKNIPTAVHYPIPIHLQGAFSHLNTPSLDLRQSEQAAKEVMSLPMHPYLTKSEIETVAEAVITAVK